MIFHHTTATMSNQEKSEGGQIFCLLPELVSNLQQDLYFYAPKKLVTSKDLQVDFFSNNKKNLFLNSFYDYTNESYISGCNAKSRLDVSKKG